MPVEDSSDCSAALDLSKPMHLRAEMARQGLTFGHLLPYEDAERGHVDPFDDDETKVAVRRFMAQLWQAAINAEATNNDQTGGSDG